LTCIVKFSVARPAAGDKEATQHEIARASIPAVAVAAVLAPRVLASRALLAGTIGSPAKLDEN
jgi:hypothetical protein